jgi:hypothetical protein
MEPPYDERQQEAGKELLRAANSMDPNMRAVMAKVIEFYTPKNFRKPLKSEVGSYNKAHNAKIIEFCSQTEKSA